MNGNKMTAKQRLFCDEYLVDLNATQAAIRAGYSKKTALDAHKWINEDTLKSPNEKVRKKYNPEMHRYISERMAEKESNLIADQNEVLKYLTSVLRGESRSSVIVVEGSGDGQTEAREMQKAPDEKERLKAAELLGKRYGAFTDKVDVGGTIPVVISGDDGLAD